MSANRVGVGKQGCGSQPHIDDTDPIRKFSIDPGSFTDLPTQQRNPASIDQHVQTSFHRKAGTETQYRPHIVDTDAIVVAASADVVSEASNVASKMPCKASTEWPFPFGLPRLFVR